MNKKQHKTPRKLPLAREQIRLLQASSLESVVGGLRLRIVDDTCDLGETCVQRGH